MSRTSVIAIFDIGKTNKKLFLFDEQYNIVLEKSEQFAEVIDEDGDACEDLDALTNWVRACLQDVFNDARFQVRALNFSTYGASFVHIDKEGKAAAPLYNYLKPYPAGLQEGFYQKYGGEITFSIYTASPVLGNLNSGMQLYRLKYTKPELFDRIHYSLHLPQYMSYLVTGRAYSDITSIGCHTGLWNFPQNHYHEWIYREAINEKLANIFPSDQLMPSQFQGHALLTGVGLHDSSAALIPYLFHFTEPFVLLSTGTWCIALNPFNQTRLTYEELQQDCLCYMEYRGKPIKASRLFAGYEHEQQTKRLAAHFNVALDYYKTVAFNADLLSSPASTAGAGSDSKSGKSAMVQESAFGARDLNSFANYEAAYHQFMADLMTQQVASLNLVLHNSPVKKIFVDGGFSKNPLYMNLLANAFPKHEVYAASMAQASAMGAALAVHAAWNKTNPSSDLIELKAYSLAKV
ncbi:carbohydrate kinase [Niastella yeongjuensis]|uniref:Carbohydrate kinase n=1 Tax=Niastella yeongjuensis TaxID=354355 RepID=A0A1V9DY82_9BACT|nr:FGGY family carbohydrate kinase [Niastella yeongjuensis]OQP38724.1 carbohydrate kinase [Niastella yeongjuensis]SEO35004.1 Sugar (pentulose or hexulose) kinase [Niastella yeongjuensis]